MNKISSIYLTGKSYIQGLLNKSAGKAESVVVEQAEDYAKVTSKQIEAYYKKYGKISLSSKQKTAKAVQKETDFRADAQLAKEGEAYNRRRFIDVSEEALKILEVNFEEKRRKVVDIISANSENLSQMFKKGIKNIKTPEDLAFYVRAYMTQSNRGVQEKYNDVIMQTLKGKNLPLKLQQQLLMDETKVNDVQIELLKTIINPSSDRKVVEIENYLKKTYGMDFVHLESIEEAEKILKTIDIVKKYDVPMPKNIIITPFTSLMSVGENLLQSSGERSIIIQSRKERTKAVEEAYHKFISPMSASLVAKMRTEDRAFFSTNDPLHLYVHEFMHMTQPLELLLSVKCKRVPNKVAEVAPKISSYACSARAELDAEVKTKGALRSLSEEEKTVMKYFE